MRKRLTRPSSGLAEIATAGMTVQTAPLPREVIE